MVKNPNDASKENQDFKEIQTLTSSQNKKLAEVAIAANESDIVNNDGRESLENITRAVDVVRDHFPEDISPKERFERDPGLNPLVTENDYKEAFSLFLQEEIIPTYQRRSDAYNLGKSVFYPHKETVHDYLEKTKKTIQVLSGESGVMPRADVAIYLDKSARPVSWFIDELWENFTDEPKPKTEHLAIDRVFWFDYFEVELEWGEYLKGVDPPRLATWRDLPIRDVTQDEIMDLRALLKDGIITHDEIDECIKKNAEVELRINRRIIDNALKNKEIQEKIERKEITIKQVIEEALDKVKILFYSKPGIKAIYDSLIIAAKLRGLFVPGGLSENDLEHPELIFDYPVGMDGKNIAIVDEVERTGATVEIAKHFVAWAFPEAANVNSHIFYMASTIPGNHSQGGQFLKIPFWYNLRHDDGSGRGIKGINPAYYEENYRNNPSSINRAAVFGSDFLGTPMDYDTETDKKSLNLRKQIARVRTEFEKGHINLND
ncbi:hypothetical protein IKG41_03085 [Candidatus Saccharibacteria bacterium]|nr:hypothetical protein [Candidatus Saccharibacteria bacterium]